MHADDPAVAHVRARLAACRAALASRQTVSGQAARAYDAPGALSFAVLPPADEEAAVAHRIALYEAWLARWEVLDAGS